MEEKALLLVKKYIYEHLDKSDNILSSKCSQFGNVRLFRTGSF